MNWAHAERFLPIWWKAEGSAGGERYFPMFREGMLHHRHYFPVKEQRERGRGQHWKIHFVGKTWLVNRRQTQERSTEIRLCLVRPVAQSLSKCFQVNFSFFRKFRHYWDFILLLRVTEITLEGLLDLLCVWMLRFSQILRFLHFIPGLQEKHFQHVVFKTSWALLFFSHPCIKFSCYMGLFLSYSSWYQLTQSYFGILKKLYHKLCLVCVWIVL